MRTGRRYAQSAFGILLSLDGCKIYRVYLFSIGSATFIRHNIVTALQEADDLCQRSSRDYFYFFYHRGLRCVFAGQKQILKTILQGGLRDVQGARDRTEAAVQRQFARENFISGIEGTYLFGGEHIARGYSKIILGTGFFNISRREIDRDSSVFFVWRFCPAVFNRGVHAFFGLR